MLTSRASTQKVRFWQRIGGMWQSKSREKFTTWGFAGRIAKMGFSTSGKNHIPANLCQIWLARCLDAGAGEASC